MNNFKLVAPCLLGLEGLVADELRRMGGKNVTPENGRVFFDGDSSGTMIARANIRSRYSERILIEVGSFTAKTFEQLFNNVKALPWESIIGKRDRFPVKGRSLSSALASVPDCQAIIKKAVVERLKTKYNIPWFEETGEMFQIQFLILKDKVSVMIDTTGAGLHKRGYRSNSVEAPIKETLAAAMVDLSHVHSNHTVIDPFCGSGTILIEAALKAMNIAPGLNRHFLCEEWHMIDDDVWQTERNIAKSEIKYDCDFKGIGYDIDRESIELTLDNARKAGVADKITAKLRNISDFTEDFERGTIICNPPYGERLLDIKQANDIYKIMGEKFIKKPGWSYTIISPDEGFEKIFGRQADKRRKLYNGMIKCQVYMYFKN